MFVSLYQSQRVFRHHYYLAILFAVASTKEQHTLYKVQTGKSIESLRYGLDDQGIVVQFPLTARDIISSYSGALSACYLIGTEVFPPGGLNRYEREPDFHIVSGLRIHRPIPALSTCLQEMVFQRVHAATCTVYTTRTDNVCY